MDNKIESYGLEELHQSLLAALNKLDQICRDNQIYYSLCGGTLLGAVRNKKFIPWDDDADLCMSREEYEKLYRIVSDLNDKTCRIDRTMLWVPRFIYKEGEKAVFVDIFVWDYISEIKWQRILKINLLRFVQGMMKSKIDYQRYESIQKILLFISYNFGKLFPKDTKRKMYEFISQKILLGKREHVHCSNDTFQGLKYIFDKNYIEDYIDMEFENKIFMANQRYEESLINYYGKDYLTPPPMAERKPAHQGMIETINK